MSILRRAGFREWADVFPPRQLVTLYRTARIVASLEVDNAVRSRLQLALCGAAEMAGFLSRWDRYYPKAFEAMANHRFPALGFACETNLLSPRGRGTLPRRLKHSVAAARWARDHLANQDPARAASSSDRRRRISSGALLITGSSERQLPSDDSVDLVLTDPPYFDDVQYAELASLFLACSRAMDLVPASVEVDLSSEVVSNPVRELGLDDYRALLTGVFRETGRTLKPSGRLILTYHNTDIRAWWALSGALADAGFKVEALAVAATENETDHPKRNRRAFTSDLVIECRRGTSQLPCVTVTPPAGSDEATELLAVGRVLAAAQDVEDLDAFTARFRSERGPIRRRLVTLPRTARSADTR